MKINANTKVTTVLKASPAAIDLLIGLSPEFGRLKNPFMRKVLAPRVTLAQAASIGGCRLEDFFAVLQPLGFEAEANVKPETEMDLPKEKLKFLAGNPDIRKFDVRPILEAGSDPLNAILAEVNKLKKGEPICIVNSFEPVPLMRLLKKKGFDSCVVYAAPSEVHTYFTPSVEEESSPETNVVVDVNEETLRNFLEGYQGRITEADVRDLEMPVPMITILELLKNLPQGYLLYVHHKKVPVYLLPELDAGGWEYFIHKAGENEVKLVIKKRPGN